MIKKVKRFFQKNAVLILSILFLVLFSGAIKIFAADPPPTPGSGGYAPGTILDPGCAPGSSADCTVNIGESFTIDADGNMFAGDVAGASLTPGLGLDNLFIGIEAGQGVTTGYRNTVIGSRSQYFNTVGDYNTSVGYSSLLTNTAGSRATAVGNGAMMYSNSTLTPFTNGSVAFGYEALRGGLNYTLNTGNYNTALGYQSLLASTSGSANTAVGYQAGNLNSTGSSSVFVGYQAGSLGGSYDNVLIGYQAGMSNSTGGNVFAGYWAGYGVTLGSDSVMIGNHAGYQTTIGDDNIFIGSFAGDSNTEGRNNIFIGYHTGNENVLGENNTAVGHQAGFENINGTGNLSLGMLSGYNILGSNNVSIGRYSGFNETGSDTFYVYNGAHFNSSVAEDRNYSLMYGTFNATPSSQTLRINASVGIGTAPSNIFHVTGTPAAGTPVARIANTLGGVTQNNGLLISAGSNTVAAAGFLIFERPDTTQIGGVFQDSASTVAYNLSSDRRIKENVSDTSFGLKDLMNIDVVDFNFISDTTQKKMTGFIAQDLYNIFPGAVTPNGDNGTDPLPKGKTPWMVDYSKLSPLLVKAIQDLDLKVEDLIIEKQNLFSNLISWFGNVENGIGDFFANRIRTKEICISDESGETCITKSQLDQILSNSGTVGTDPEPTLEPDPVEPNCEELGNCTETGLESESGDSVGAGEVTGSEEVVVSAAE